MKTLIIDANSILNRAFYGVRPLSAPDGRRTEAVYGALNMIARQLSEYDFDCAAAAFDVHAPTFRHKADESYKAGRHPTPPELLSQFPIFKEALCLLGISVLECEGYEADDIIGTLASRTERDGGEAYVLTGDRDSLQLISDKTTVLLATNTETIPYTPDKFAEKYGITPDRYVFVKALMGDSSDNIKGVAGIGEKTAFKLISDYGTLDSLYENYQSSSLSAGVKAKLEAGKESAYHSLFLATIVRDAPIGDEPLPPMKIKQKEARDFFVSLGFKSFLSRFGLEKTKAPKEEKGALDAQTSLFDMNEDAEKPQEYTKTTVGELIGKSGVLDCVFLPDSLRVSCEGGLFEVAFGDFAELSPLFTDGKKLCCFDTKAVYHRLIDAGINDFDFSFDIMLAAYVLDSTDGDYSLSRVAAKYAANPFAREDDAAIITSLREALTMKLLEEGSEKLFSEIELPLSHLLAEMEATGFRVDIDGLSGFSEKLTRSAREYEEKIYEIAGGPFNINSPKQLSVVLFEKLALPAKKKTKSGYSTDAEVLESLRPYNPIIDLILDYRQVAKLNSTYAIGLREAADHNARVHSVFKQTGTATGRLSSAEPNLQNIPIRTELGREMRRFFLPEEGKVLLDADYSQIELRILASLSGDPNMTQAFISGEDIHSSTASKVFRVPIEEVTPEMRKRAKAVNFGIVYGIGDYSLSQDIGTSVAQAKEYIQSYFDTYPCIREFLDHSVTFAEEHGYVTTLFGRRRYLPELSSGKAQIRAFAQRVARNSPIQGTAADIMKIAMVAVRKGLREAGIDAKIILQVHDELVIEASRECAEEASKILQKGMESAFSGGVPMVAEVSVGENWYENK